MDEIFCTQCGKAITDGWVSRSGHCHACATANRIAREKARPGKARRILKKYWWFWALWAVTILAVIISISLPKVPKVILDANGKPTEDALTWFTIVAETAVEDQLIAPKTAEFDPTSEVWGILENDEYFIAGTVTSDNSFGVPIETEFVVRFRCTSLDRDGTEVLEVGIQD